MTDDGGFGFGHFRYQEHLAAQNLMHDRSIDVLHFAGEYHWEGVLTLFAQMNDTLRWLVEAAVEVGLRDQSQAAVLKRMVSCGPRHERAALGSLLDSNEELLDLESLWSEPEGTFDGTT